MRAGSGCTLETFLGGGKGSESSSLDDFDNSITGHPSCGSTASYWNANHNIFAEDHDVVGMTLCMVITCGKGKDQPGKVVNPARSQLNRENNFFLVTI